MPLDTVSDLRDKILPLRGDPITGDRYYSRDFMQQEWDHMWTRVWHVGGLVSDLEQPGDYVVHNFKHESVIMVRQEDGSIRAFYNVCRHRGNQLVWAEGLGGAPRGFTCSYHGWQWGVDGVLKHAQDAENFAGGSPCERVKLKELRCDHWGGMIWYTIDDKAPPLLDYLDPIPGLMKNRKMEKMTRVVWMTTDVQTNWKFSPDNFNESYHLPTVHPQLATLIDEDYKNTVFEMHEAGHNRMIEQGQPSMRAPHPNQVEAPWDSILEAWDLNPADFAGRARDGRAALQRQKRELGPARGYADYAHYTDEELTDYIHHTLFPNVTITGTPDGIHFFRTEPHKDDPERCTFDYWYFAPDIPGMDEIQTICGPKPFAPAEHERVAYEGRGLSVEENKLGNFLDQDLSVAVAQQRGLHSRGFDDAILSGQENRVRRFHEVLNDYLEGRR